MYAISFKISYQKVDETIHILSHYFPNLSCFEDQDSGESGLLDDDGFPIPLLFDVTILTQDHTQSHFITYLLQEDIIFHIEEVYDQDWLKICYQNFKPIIIDQFFIYSSYAPEEVPAGMLGLKIDAATAFGSGEHQTTKGCLQAVSEYVHAQTTRILDMGCGSGILGLCAALKNPFADVLGVDIDSKATIVAQQNAHLNSIHNFSAITSQGFDSLEKQQYHLIVANILAKPLIQMANHMYGFLQNDGHIILSGLLERQQEDVIQAYQNAGFIFIKSINLNDWMTLIFKK